MKRSILGGLVLALVTTIAHSQALVSLPRQLVVDGSGAPRSGAKLYVYRAGTTTALATYTTPALTTAHANPVVAVATGLFPAIYVPSNVASYKLVLKDSADVTIYTEDNIPNQQSDAAVYDVRAAGVVADSTSARSANSTAFADLVDASEAGIEGRIIFPNLDGTTTYYFDAVPIEIRDRIQIDCNGSTLDFSGTYAASNDTYGFLNFIRDVSVENCNINVDYDGSSGTNNGSGIRIGSRIGYPFGSDADGIEDEDESVPMGNIVLRNVRITSDNPSGAPVLMLGGLDNVSFENVVVNGATTARKGIYYEFGFYHYEATVANRKSSHATNMNFRNVTVTGLATASTGTPTAFGLTGVMNASVDGLNIDGGYVGFSFRPGEALYYNKGVPNADQRAAITMRNVAITDTASTAFSFLGAESKSGGYLSGEAGVTEALQTDLASLSLDGFSIEGVVVLSGRSAKLHNGVARGGSASGGIILQDELMWFDFNNIRVLDSAGIGIRSQTSTNIWSVVRFKSGIIRNCMVAGSADEGITLANSKGVIIDACRFGYEAIHDGVAETTQNAGVSNASTAHNTTVRNSYGGGIQSGSMYTNAGSGGWKFAMLENLSGDRSISGQWTVDGYGSDTDIGDNSTTLDYGVDLPYQRMDTTLTTANKTITLGTCNAAAKGGFFRLTRTGGGAFTVDVGGLKTIASGTAAFVEVACNGSAWQLSAYGPL